jgi:hypothetical protein
MPVPPKVKAASVYGHEKEKLAEQKGDTVCGVRQATVNGIAVHLQQLYPLPLLPRIILARRERRPLQVAGAIDGKK